MATRSPTKTIPKRLRSEESAVIQLLIDHLGWRFSDSLPERDKHPYWMNFITGKGGVARAFVVIVPTNSILAREFDRLAKQKKQAARKAAKAKRAKKRRATRAEDS